MSGVIALSPCRSARGLYAGLALVGLLIACRAVAGPTDWLRARMPELLQEHRVPGASVALVQDGQISWAQGFGVRDAREAQPVTPSTVFEAASLSKPVLALGALQLIQQGRLDLDTPLVSYLGRDYLPDQPAHRRITARMALTHRTGFPNWRESDDETGPLPVLFEPGTHEGYSGEGILFLQRAMEAITGEPLETWMRRTLFDPLRLRHTSFVWNESIERELASGHDASGAFKQRSRYERANGAYTLYTTPSDYARLILTLLDPPQLGDRAFTPQSIALMLARQYPAEDAGPLERSGSAEGVSAWRALGWRIRAGPEGDIVQHSGSNSSGFKAFAEFNPRTRSALVLFLNGDGGGAVREIVGAQFGNP